MLGFGIAFGWLLAVISKDYGVVRGAVFLSFPHLFGVAAELQKRMFSEIFDFGLWNRRFYFISQAC